MVKFLYYFSIVFFVVYLFYLFFVILNKKKRDNIFNTNQSKLIIEPDCLDVICISNSFIVAFTFACSEFFDNYILKLLVCFLILIVLIFVVYRFIGFVYKKKEGR